MPPQRLSSSAAFHMFILCADFRNSAKEEGLKRYIAVSLFQNVDGEETQKDSVSLCGPAHNGFSTLQYHIPSHAAHRDDGSELITLCTAIVLDEVKAAHLHSNHSTGGLPCTLTHIGTASAYA